MSPHLHDGTIRGSHWLHDGAGAEQVLGRRQRVNPALVRRGHGSGEPMETNNVHVERGHQMVERL